MSEADPIEQKILQAQKRGQVISPEVRGLMHAWAQRQVKVPNTGVNKGHNPKGLTHMEVGNLPIPCNCFSCGEPAVIFPSEEDTPRGYCVCPKCSFAPQDLQATP